MIKIARLSCNLEASLGAGMPCLALERLPHNGPVYDSLRNNGGVKRTVYDG